MPVAKAVQLIKAGSSKWLREQKGLSLFGWHEAYGAFTIGASQLFNDLVHPKPASAPLTPALFMRRFQENVILSEDRALERQARFWPDACAVRVEGPAFHTLSGAVEVKTTRSFDGAPARPAESACRKDKAGASLRMTTSVLASGCDVVAWLKKPGKGCQTRANCILREHMLHELRRLRA